MKIVLAVSWQVIGLVILRLWLTRSLYQPHIYSLAVMGNIPRTWCRRGFKIRPERVWRLWFTQWVLDLLVAVGKKLNDKAGFQMFIYNIAIYSLASVLYGFLWTLFYFWTEARLFDNAEWFLQVSVRPGGRWNRFKTYSTIQRTLEIWGSVFTFIFRAWLNNQKFSYRGWSMR